MVIFEKLIFGRAHWCYVNAKFILEFLIFCMNIILSEVLLIKVDHPSDLTVQCLFYDQKYLLLVKAFSNLLLLIMGTSDSA